MAKCLVTKLNGSIDNNELLKIGEMRIKVESVESPTKDTQGFGVSFTEPTTVEIVGDGYFTDNNLTENKGKSMVVSSLQGVIVSQATTVAIRNKYKLLRLHVFIPSGSPYGKNKVLNIDDLKYSTSLNSLNLSNMQASGDIASLKSLTSLSILILRFTQVSGDIANLKNLTALTELDISKTKISGDIANLKNLTALTSLILNSAKVEGDISNLKNLTALTNLNISSTNISGNIANLQNLTALTNLFINNTQISGDITNIYFALRGTTKEFSVADCNNLSGDLASLPNNILFFNSIRGNSKFTWTRGSSRTNILACINLHCTNIDDMLNDMANMTASFAGQEVRYKNIGLVGTRTSASDAAVQTLQSKGYTVSINPA